MNPFRKALTPPMLITPTSSVPIKHSWTFEKRVGNMYLFRQKANPAVLVPIHTTRFWGTL